MTQILIVDDDEPVRILIGSILKENGYDCSFAADALEARKFLKERDFELLLSDISMPGESGMDFIRYAIAEYPDTAAVMVTAMNDLLVAEDALQTGVYDYIIKPFDPNGVLISVENALRRRKLEVDNRAYRESLQKMVEERTSALQDSMDKLGKALEGSIHAMALTVETRDPYTAGHQQRVANLANAIAREIGLSEERIEGVRMAGLIHDLGKISLPAEILSKPGRITKIEFDLIKTHPKVGYDILKSIEFPWPIAQMVLQHHERMCGSGYPLGLRGKEILLEARILAVADVVEAMASHRPYRPALGIDKALGEISENRTSMYDPEVVDACLNIFRKKSFGFD
ncbi:MAG: response regulator [Thermodesulfobacteriota bacterium]|nr:response regulator [Thermodesulfobacteriota bacterium]